MTEKCQYCKRLLDDPKDPTTKDCGGDCLRCMAQIIEDPDCIIEILNIRIEDLRGALVDLLHAVCGEKGFAEAVRRDSGRIYPWPALELAEAKALAALDKENDPKTVPAG